MALAVTFLLGTVFEHRGSSPLPMPPLPESLGGAIDGENDYG